MNPRSNRLPVVDALPPVVELPLVATDPAWRASYEDEAIAAAVRVITAGDDSPWDIWLLLVACGAFAFVGGMLGSIVVHAIAH